MLELYYFTNKLISLITKTMLLKITWPDLPKSNSIWVVIAILSIVSTQYRYSEISGWYTTNHVYVMMVSVFLFQSIALGWEGGRLMFLMFLSVNITALIAVFITENPKIATSETWGLMEVVITIWFFFIYFNREHNASVTNKGKGR